MSGSDDHAGDPSPQPRDTAREPADNVTEHDALPFFCSGHTDVVKLRGETLDEPTWKNACRTLGGKAAGLHRLASLRHNVPPGFTIPISRSGGFDERGERDDDEPSLQDAIAAAVARLEDETGRTLSGGAGSLRLAVRSGAAESLPGMMDTVLDVDSHESLLDAVERVVRSFHGERARRYRFEFGILGLAGTGVTVQEMCAADVSGVLFSRAPDVLSTPKDNDAPAATAAPILIEAVPGLGEGLVSGDVTPQTYRLARPNVGTDTPPAPTEAPENAVGAPDAEEPLLRPTDLARLADVAVTLEAQFGRAVDVEWSLHDGRLFLLQVRAIQNPSPSLASERGGGSAHARSPHELYRAELERLKKHSTLPQLENEKTAVGICFVRHNLDETVRHPTMLTWNIISKHFQQSIIQLYRDLGFSPALTVRTGGFLYLFAGHIYTEVHRAAALYYGDGLLHYDPEVVGRHPELLSSPPTIVDRAALTPWSLLAMMRASGRVERRLQRLRRSYRSTFEENILPDFLDWCEQRSRIDLKGLNGRNLLGELRGRTRRVYEEFPRDALKLSYLAGEAFAALSDYLQRHFGECEGSAFAARLVATLEGDAALAWYRDLERLHGGESSVEAFMDRHGHRGIGEMELAAPRWWEEPAAIETEAEAFNGNQLERLEQQLEAQRAERNQAEEQVLRHLEALGGTEETERFRELLGSARDLLPWRERWKDSWMRGVDLVRRVLLEIDERVGTDGLVFHLTVAEITDLVATGRRPSDELAARVRARCYQARQRRDLSPPTSFAWKDRERLGRDLHSPLEGQRDEEDARVTNTPPAKEVEGEQKTEQKTGPTASRKLDAVPLSPGVTTGVVRVCASPRSAPRNRAPERFVLVCPSTDPGWMPLLARATAVVVERGGSLSHGALVCRNLGIPAVALPDACSTLADGDSVTVDGAGGVIHLGVAEVAVAEEAAAASDSEADTRPDVEGDPTNSPDPAEREGIQPQDDTSYGPEPYVSPARPGAWRRVVSGVAVAIVVCAIVFSISTLRSIVTAAVAPVLDWTVSADLPPLYAIAIAAFIAAAVGAALGWFVSRRARLAKLRARWNWYRDRLRNGDVKPMVRAALTRRGGEARRAHVLELLRPLPLAFLPFCITFAWVQDRFRAEPLRPQTSVPVVAYFDPGPDHRYIRYARLDVVASEAAPEVELIDPSYRAIEPNDEDPTVAPYRVRWRLRPRGTGPLRVAISAGDERVEATTLITERRELAPIAPKHTTAGASVSPGAAGAIRDLVFEHPPLHMELPGPIYTIANTVARWFNGGVDLPPGQATPGAGWMFIGLATIFALVLQRLFGLR